MPEYLGKSVEGACERIGHPCVNRKHFIEVANEVKASPKQVEETLGWIEEEGRAEVIKVWKLQIPEEYETLAKTLVDEEVSTGWLTLWELPCFAGCGIAVCGYCGKQHGEGYVHDDWCELEPYNPEEEELWLV